MKDLESIRTGRTGKELEKKKLGWDLAYFYLKF
jgi:hypothetical protein